VRSNGSVPGVIVHCGALVGVAAGIVGVASGAVGLAGGRDGVGEAGAACVAVGLAATAVAVGVLGGVVGVGDDAATSSESPHPALPSRTARAIETSRLRILQVLPLMLPPLRRCCVWTGVHSTQMPPGGVQIPISGLQHTIPTGQTVLPHSWRGNTLSPNSTRRVMRGPPGCGGKAMVTATSSPSRAAKTS
jgi:hypothetical protein